jgi:hypothetical protein
MVVLVHINAFFINKPYSRYVKREEQKLLSVPVYVVAILLIHFCACDLCIKFKVTH